MATDLSSLVHLCCVCVWAGGHCKQIPLGCVGSAHSGWAILVLSQPKVMCPSRVYTARATDCSARALFQVHLTFCALLKSKPLKFPGAPQGHRPKWAVYFVPFTVLSSSGNQVLGKLTVRGGTCILIASLVKVTQFHGCAVRAQSQVCHVSPLGR